MPCYDNKNPCVCVCASSCHCACTVTVYADIRLVSIRGSFSFTKRDRKPGMEANVK